MRKLRIFTTSLLGFFVALLSHSALSATPGSFNGYSAGMPKSAAKAIGYGSCREAIEMLGGVACDIPADKRSLSRFEPSTATLYFHKDNLNIVNSILLIFDGNFSRDVSFSMAMADLYGRPIASKEYEDYWRFGDSFIELNKASTRTTKIRFYVDPSLARSVDKQTQKNNAMKNF
jgi:hypothetical protein